MVRQKVCSDRLASHEIRALKIQQHRFQTLLVPAQACQTGRKDDNAVAALGAAIGRQLGLAVAIQPVNGAAQGGVCVS
jgi:hypothetical protein